MTDPLTPDLDDIESKAKAALCFQPEPPSDGWPDGEPETAPEWDATSGWLEDGGHAAFGRQHEYSDDQESDGADVDAAYIKALDPTTVLALVAECRELRRLRGELADVHALDALACRHGTRLDIPAEIPGFDPGDGSDHLHFVLMPIGARSRRAALEYLAKMEGT